MREAEDQPARFEMEAMDLRANPCGPLLLHGVLLPLRGEGPNLARIYKGRGYLATSEKSGASGLTRKAQSKISRPGAQV